MSGGRPGDRRTSIMRFVIFNFFSVALKKSRPHSAHDVPRHHAVLEFRRGHCPRIQCDPEELQHQATRAGCVYIASSQGGASTNNASFHINTLDSMKEYNYPGWTSAQLALPMYSHDAHDDVRRAGTEEAPSGWRREARTRVSARQCVSPRPTSCLRHYI